MNEGKIHPFLIRNPSSHDLPPECGHQTSLRENSSLATSAFVIASIVAGMLLVADSALAGPPQDRSPRGISSIPG